MSNTLNFDPVFIEQLGELGLAFQLTPGNISDVSMVETLSRGIVGKLFGDKGYVSSKLARQLFERGLQLFTTVKSNMKQKLLSLRNKLLLRKRSIIETVNDQLKNISQIEHTRHRSPQNFLINLLSAITAYSLQPKKPSLKFDQLEKALLFVCNPLFRLLISRCCGFFKMSVMYRSSLVDLSRVPHADPIDLASLTEQVFSPVTMNCKVLV